MAYIPVIDEVQFGKELTWGTAVAGSAKMMLVEDCTIEPDVIIQTLPDVRGSMAPGYVATLDAHSGAASISGWATYQDLPYFLDSLLMIATPGGANPYVYAYTGQLGAAPTRRKITLIKGQTGAVQTLAGGVVNEFTLKIETNKPWSYSAKLIGKSVVDGSLASLADRTVVPIHANQTTLYVDAVDGTIGTTAIATQWFSAELSVKNGAVLVPSVGSLQPPAYIDGRASATLKLTMDVVASTAAYLTAILGTALSQKQIRIKATTGTSAIAQFDFGGTFSKAPAISSDTDGVRTYEFELEGIYNVALTNWLAASVTNAVATLP